MGERVAFGMNVEVIAVPFAPDTTGMVSEQWNLGVNQNRPALLSHNAEGPLHGVLGSQHIVPCDGARFKSGIRFCCGLGISKADF